MTEDKKPKTSNVVKEWGGGSFNGAPSFQGVAFGYDGKNQLAQPERHVTKDFQEILDSFVQDELEGLYPASETTLMERDPGDGFYRDLPGSPGGMNNLVVHRQHVPVDRAEINNVDFLGPTVNGMELGDIGNSTTNNWKATTPEKRGRATIDMNALVKDQEVEDIHEIGIWSQWNPAQLVAPRNFQQELEDSETGDATAKSPLGGMGYTTKPRTFVPASAEYMTVNRESLGGNVITTKESLNMKLNEINLLITEVVLNELEEASVQQFGSDELMGQVTQNLVGIVNKYGGDYEKAYASEEWKQATKSAEEQIAGEKTSAFPPLVQPFQTGLSGPSGTKGTSPPPTNLKSKLQALKPGAGQQGTPQTGETQAVQSQDKKQQLLGKLASLRTKQKQQESLQRGTMKKIDEVIAEIARRVIVEELEKLMEVFGGPEHPVDGQVEIEPETGREYTYDARSGSWLSPEDLSARNEAQSEEESLLASGNEDMSGGLPPDVDPMANNQQMIDSLLNMEFNESATKTLPTHIVEQLVRKCVRRHLGGE